MTTQSNPREMLERLLRRDEADNYQPIINPDGPAVYETVKAEFERLNSELERTREEVRLMPDEIEVFRIMQQAGGSRANMAKAVGRRIEEIRAALHPEISDDRE